MPRTACIELRDLVIACAIGTYGPDDVVPDAHLLDLTLTISPDLVQIPADQMDQVFDYDPLIARIDELAREQHYATQEYLMTRIITACAQYPAVQAVEIALRKTPVLNGSGTLGVRLTLNKDDMAALRAKAA